MLLKFIEKVTYGTIISICFMISNFAQAEEILKPGSAEFEAKVKEMKKNFTTSPQVLKEIQIMEKKYPERSGAPKYQRAGHQFTTYIVSMLAGLGSERSYKLSYFSQYPDDEVRYSATLAFFYLFSQDYRKQIMAVLHSLHGEGELAVLKRRNDLKELINDGIQNNSLDDHQLGMIIHAFGDSYAHTTEEDGELKAFDYDWGHLFHGKKPDVIIYNPQKYNDYACELFKVLSQHAECMPQLKDLRAMIKRLEISRNAELPEFEKYAKEQLGFEQVLYEQKGIQWSEPISKADVVKTITLIEEKINQ